MRLILPPCAAQGGQGGGQWGSADRESSAPGTGLWWVLFRESGSDCSTPAPTQNAMLLVVDSTKHMFNTNVQAKNKMGHGNYLRYYRCVTAVILMSCNSKRSPDGDQNATPRSTPSEKSFQYGRLMLVETSVRSALRVSQADTSSFLCCCSSVITGTTAS